MKLETNLASVTFPFFFSLSLSLDVAGIETIEFANLEEAEKEHHIPEGEIRVVRALIKKHGDDYQAMARDHRINDLQHTARQLQKKCERYLKSVAYMMSLGDLDGAPAAEENDDHDDDDSNSEE